MPITKYAIVRWRRADAAQLLAAIQAEVTKKYRLYKENGEWESGAVPRA